MAETLEERQLRAVLRELERRGELKPPPDPLERLFDPEFRETLWEYEGSHVEPMIPGQLHPKQEEALSRAASDFVWLFWGNQVGKTTLGAINHSTYALGRHPNQRHPPPVTLWASALTWDLWEQILLPELLTWIPDDRIIDAPPPGQQSTKRTIKIRADNGSVSRIIGKSAEQGRKKYQSARVHGVWLDEEHPEPIYDELLLRMVRHGGWLVSSMTPLLGLTWVYHRIYQPIKRGQLRGHFYSHAGLEDNPAITEEAREMVRRELAHDPVQCASRMSGQFGVPAGLVWNLEDRHIEHTPWEDLIDTARRQRWEHFCGIDFGYWRFAFVHLAADRAKRVHVLQELFSQKESLEARAEWIHEYLTAAQAPKNTVLWADSANPQDILEINLALEEINSPWRAVGVSKTSAEGKGYRRVGVDRVLKLLARGAFLVQSDIGNHRAWKLGQSAASEGRTQLGSRLRYEFGAWRYPKPTSEEKAQDQDPDDDTADGADMCAAIRMAVVSWWDGAAVDLPEEDVSAFDPEMVRAAAEEAKKVKPAWQRRRKKQSVDPMNIASIE